MLLLASSPLRLYDPHPLSRVHCLIDTYTQWSSWPVRLTWWLVASLLSVGASIASFLWGVFFSFLSLFLPVQQLLHATLAVVLSPVTSAMWYVWESVAESIPSLMLDCHWCSMGSVSAVTEHAMLWLSTIMS